VPYYLVKNHHAVIAVATEKILEKMQEKEEKKKGKKRLGKDAEDDLSSDEEVGGVGEERTEEPDSIPNNGVDESEDDWEWDDDYFGAPPDSY
jgi:hypothetical protein